MRYLSLFSGIEAASLAWEPLGWEPMAFAEIEPFPSQVLSVRWPEVENLGDVTAVDWKGWLAECGRPDVMVAGSPCQAFSVAGGRMSLEDARGNLTLFTAELVRFLEPSYYVWENVPGALNTRDNAFGCLLGELVGAGEALHPTGKRWTNAGLVSGPEATAAWRVLDAQYFGVAQRRRRLFVVRCPRDGADPAAVLFESEGVRWDSSPRRQAKQEVAGTLGGSSQSGGFRTTDLDNTGAFVVDDAEAGHIIMASGQTNAEIGEGISPALAARQYNNPPIAFKPSHYTRGKDGAPSEVVPPLMKEDDRGDQEAVVLAPEVADPISASEGKTYTHEGEHNFRLHNVVGGMAVRRLTPRECERLQGMPDDHTRISWRGKVEEDCPDGPRYKAIGNSMAVPVMRWIGERIDRTEVK